MKMENKVDKKQEISIFYTNEETSLTKTFQTTQQNVIFLFQVIVFNLWMLILVEKTPRV